MLIPGDVVVMGNTDDNIEEAIKIATHTAKENRRKKKIAEALDVAGELDNEAKDNEASKVDDYADLVDDCMPYVDEKAIKAVGKRKRYLYKIAISVICVLTALFVCFALIFVIVSSSGRKKLKQDSPNNPELAGDDIRYQDDYVYHNDKKYKYNESIITILVMGIDDKQDSDTNILVVIDTDKEKISLININRDSIGKVKVYNPAGEYITTSDVQIALAYSYGNNDEQSCKLMKDTVSSLMYQLPVHGYISVNMSDIPDINDSVGGVTLTAIESVGKKIKEGKEIKLSGKLALKYVTERDSRSGEVGTNSIRLKRQNQYINEWYKQFASYTDNSPSKIMDVYDSLKTCLVSDLDFDEIVYLSNIVSKCDLSWEDIYELPGTYERSNYYDEYIIDEDELVELILDIFYGVDN